MQTKIVNDSFFVVRTPRIPHTWLSSLGSNAISTRRKLVDWLKLDGVSEALYLASPSLLERIEDWKKNPTSKKGEKIELALIKYFIRMTSRATPFGLFSGVSLGHFDSNTQLISNTFDKDERKTRLDVFYLSSIKEHLLKNERKSEYLTYYPNPSCYFLGTQCRYIEAYNSHSSRQYRLSAIESDEYFVYLLELAQAGRSFQELVNSFLKRYKEAEREVVEDYVSELIEESVLLANLPIPLVGKSPDLGLLQSLKKIKQPNFVEKISSVLDILREGDLNNGLDINTYQNSAKLLEELPVKVQTSMLFQVDTYRSFKECRISEKNIIKLRDNLLILKAIGPGNFNPLSDFISKFNQRFEGQLVPLSQLLDDETGINFSSETGYESPLLAGINITKNTVSSSGQVSDTILHRFILKELSLPENRNKDIIRLKSKELKKITGNRNVDQSLPASFASIISAYIDEAGNEFYKLNGCYGPSAANLIGRFCHLNTELEEKIKKHLKWEEAHSPEVIFAEVVHLPEGRPGNILARPKLRDFEIIFMAGDNLDLNPNYQIAVDDLYVWVEEGKVKLWSKNHNKQVIPRLSSAHNYSARSLSIYKFLSMLQKQYGVPPVFTLPETLNHSSFLPRITLDDLILSEKSWVIPRKALAEIYNNFDIDKLKLKSVMDKYQLDEVVSYSVDDNILQINLNNPQMLRVLLNETKGKENVQLKEVLTSKYRTPITDDNHECFSNEIIVPFLNPGATKHHQIKSNPLSDINAHSIRRRFSPGSEWLSIKIYSGNSMVESVLTDKIVPLIDASSNNFSKWFFIRYADPDWHLRLRFQGKPEYLYGQLLPLLNEWLSPMLESGEIQKIELFTYERELERYGGPRSIEVVETIFMLDSQLVANTLSLCKEFGEDLRWRVASLATDKILSMFDYELDDKLAIISRLRTGFGNEFNDNASLRKQLGKRYREIEGILSDDFFKIGRDKHCDFSEPQLKINNLLSKWQDNISVHIKSLLSMFEDVYGLNCSKDNLIESLLHMHNNRMFKAYGREQELVMHDIVRRWYTAEKKRPEHPITSVTI